MVSGQTRTSLAVVLALASVGVGVGVVLAVRRAGRGREIAQAPSVPPDAATGSASIPERLPAPPMPADDGRKALRTELESVRRRVAEIPGEIDRALAEVEAIKERARREDADLAALRESVDARRKAVERALEAHPAVAAMREERTRVKEESLTTSRRQADISKDLRGKVQGRLKTYEGRLMGEIVRMHDELVELLRARGKGLYDARDEADNKAVAELQGKQMERYAKLKFEWSDELRKGMAERTEPEHAQVREYEQLSAAYKGAMERTRAIDVETPALKQRLRREDRDVAALNREWTEENVRLSSRLESLPGVQAGRRKAEALAAEHTAMEKRAAELEARLAGTNADARANDLGVGQTGEFESRAVVPGASATARPRGT